LRLLATIEACPPKVHRRWDPAIATKILAHLGLDVEPPPPAAARPLTWLSGCEPEFQA